MTLPTYNEIEMDIIKKLIQLGEERPQLQGHLRVIIDDLKGVKPAQNMNWYEESERAEKGQVVPPKEDGPKMTEPHGQEPKHDPEGDAFFSSPKARQAFEEVILPQIESKAENFSFEDVYEMMNQIESLGTSKNNDLENALIVYKPISKNTERFYTEIQDVFKDWIVPKLKNIAPENGNGDSGDNKNYNFNFQ